MKKATENMIKITEELVCELTNIAVREMGVSGLAEVFGNGQSDEARLIRKSVELINAANDVMKKQAEMMEEMNDKLNKLLKMKEEA